MSQVMLWLGVFVILVRVAQKISLIRRELDEVRMGAPKEVKPRAQDKV